MTLKTERSQTFENSIPESDDAMTSAAMDRMADSAVRAAQFMKTFSHEGRLMMLCHLSTGEKSVSELEALLSCRQSAVSQQLTRLRHDGLVTPRRSGQTIYYSLADARVKQVMDVLYDLFCGDD